MLENEIDLNSYIQGTIKPYPLTPLMIEMINVFLKGIFESITLVNGDGDIEYVDPYTEKFFSLERGKARGLHITDLMPKSTLHIVAQTGLKEVGKIWEINGEKKIVARFPIKKKGQIIGAIAQLMFQHLDDIDALIKEISELRSKIVKYQKSFEDLNSTHYAFDDIIGNSSQLLDVKQFAMKASLTESNVLLYGESGTGKELFAQSIHNMSSRQSKPFIRINCPAIPFELAESELFGYEKGAFSGASSYGKPGKFELCNGGTIFLDEIASLPLGIQAKVLRVLQEKEMERLGGKKLHKIDFRLISATNMHLKKLINEGRFRSDLYYRINTVPIEIPPLRKRREDINLYIKHFLEKTAQRLKTRVMAMSDEALQIMQGYKWPGNVRELINVLEQAILNVNEGNMIQKKHLPSSLFDKKKKHYILEPDFNLKKIKEEAETQSIKKVLDITRGNKRKAAEILGIQRAILYQKLKKYHLNYHGSYKGNLKIPI